MKIVCCSIFFVLTFNVFSQINYESVYDAESIMAEGIKLHDDKKYAEAILEYDKINKLDPKYSTAQYEKLLSLVSLEKNEEANALFEKIYADGLFKNDLSLYILYANFLSDEKNYDKSEKIFQEAGNYLKNSSNYLFNYALLHVRKKELQKAVDLLKKAVTINPNMASAHYYLGSLALEDGKIAEGTLALMSYLAISPSGRYASDALVKLDAKFTNNYSETPKLKWSDGGDNFEDIEVILKNGLALKPAYKVNSEFTDIAIRQVQAVSEYALEHKIGDGFFENLYIPWIKDMMNKKFFEGYSYFMLMSIEDKLGKKLSSQKKKILNFQDEYRNKFWNVFAERTMLHYGTLEKVIVTINKGKPYLIGKIIDGKYQGKHLFVNDNGNIAGDLTFLDDELEGPQKYYNEKGQLTEEKTFSKGKLNGTRTAYLTNGNIDFIETFTDGVLNGPLENYHVNGGKNCVSTFVDGERDGQSVCYAENGSIISEINYLKGKLNGIYKEYNKNGDLVFSGNYTDGKEDGLFQNFYDGKILKSEITYSNGKPITNFKSYYPNKQLEKENVYENQKLKTVTEYAPSGLKTSFSIYNEKEEIERFSYFDNFENKFYEELFQNNVMKSGLQYSINNPKPAEISLSKPIFNWYSIDGKLKAEGAFKKGIKIGEWNYYFNNGQKKSNGFFENGLETGKTTTFDTNGDLLQIYNSKKDSINGIYDVYKNGILEVRYSYKNNQQNGPFQTFYADGKVSSEGMLVDGQTTYKKNSYRQDGSLSTVNTYLKNIQTNVDYFDKNEKLIRSIAFVNKNGAQIDKFDGSVTVQTSNYKNGLFEGNVTLKNKLGENMINVDYKNGFLNGPATYFGPTGLLSTKANYYIGELHGKYQSFDLIGNLRLEDEYLFGESYGKTIRYYVNKQKLLEYNEIKDIKHGDYHFYNHLGEKVLTINYVANQPVYYLTLDNKNQVNQKTKIENGTAIIKSTYSNGKLAVSMTVKNDFFDGKLEIFNVLGKTIYEVNYDKGKLNGARIEYFENGNIYKNEHFVNANYDGIQQYFDNNNQKRLTAIYKNDELHGDILIYKDGKPKVTKKYDSDELVDIIEMQ